MTPSLEVMRSELEKAMAGHTPGRDAADALCAASTGWVGVDGAAVSVVSDGVSSGTFGSSDEASRRLDEYQFTFGEGPCLEAVATRSAVLVPDMNSPKEHRWPAFQDAVLHDGIRGVFALPIMVTSVCVGALDLFRRQAGPLHGDALTGARLVAQMASGPLIDLIAEAKRLTAANDESFAADEPEGDTSSDMDRVEVYQASGMLIHALGVDAQEALVRLRAHAIATGQTASEVARAIIERRLVLEKDDKPDSGGAHHG